MSKEFTKDELRDMLVAVERLPFVDRLDAGMVVRLGECAAKLKARITATLHEPERGELVFEWRVPAALALTMNSYAGSRGWKKHKDRKLLDKTLAELLPQFPKAVLHGVHKRRWIRGTRFSPRRVDELALEVLGCKMPIDALKRADVIHEDNDAFLVREPRWEKTKPGNTHLLVQVYELAERQVAAPEPKDSAVVQIVHEPGFMTQAIIGGAR